MPTLQDLENVAAVAAPVVGGAINAGETSNAVGNLQAGTQQAQQTVEQAQQNAQNTLNTVNQENQTNLQPLEPGGAVSTQTANANASLLQPYQQAGTTALTAEQNMVDNPNYDFTQDPSYQFRLQQGEAAINAGANAGGTRFTAATLKALNDYAGSSASQEFGNEFNRQAQIVGQGEQAANEGVSANLTEAQQQQQATEAGVNANTQYGAQTTQLDTQTAAAVAQLQQEAAQAAAAGNIAQANNINGVIQGLTSAATNQQTLQQLSGILNPGSVTTPSFGATPAQLGGFIGPQPAATATGAAAGATSTGAAAAGTGADLASVGAAAEGSPLAGTGVLAAGDLSAGAAPVAAGAEAAAGGEAAAEAGGEAAASSAGGLSGALSTVSSLMTNPITIGVGAALAGALIWKSTQTHPVANTFVQNYQNPFGQHLGSVVNSFDSALASGQLTKAQATTAYNATQQLITQFESDGAKFAQGGDKQMSVWKQAQRTMAQDFGGQVSTTGMSTPDWSKVLGKMQQEIANLPG